MTRLNQILSAFSTAPTLDAACQEAKVTRGTLQLLVASPTVRHALAVRGWRIDLDTGRIGDVRRPDLAAWYTAATRGVAKALTGARPA